MHSLNERRNYRLTDGTTPDREPVFDPEGRYLYFLSDRDYNLAFSSYEFNWLYNNATRIYAVPLRADQPPLYPNKSDEVAIAKDGDDVTTHPFAHKVRRIEPFVLRRVGYIRGWPWSAGSWRCGSRLGRTGPFGSIRRLSV